MSEGTGSGEHLIIEPDDLRDGEFSLSGEGFFHLSKVKRARRGEEFTWSDGAGRAGRAVLERMDGSTAVFRVLEMRGVCRRVPVLRLYQALPKAGKMEDIMRRCTEVGVDHFIPFTSSRSVPDLKGYWNDQRRRRWDRVLKEAARQSRRDLLPTAERPRSWEECLDMLRGEELALLGWEGERSRRLLEALPPEAPTCVAMVVGPEGGFSKREVDGLRGAGVIPVTLGSNVLRTENAGMVMAVLVGGFYGFI